jgi:hypothetical protein
MSLLFFRINRGVDYSDPEDPWCSVNGHYDDDPGMVYGENSKTGHMEHLGINGVGACVWLK